MENSTPDELIFCFERLSRVELMEIGREFFDCSVSRISSGSVNFAAESRDSVSISIV